MLTIVTWLWGDKYGAHYVDRLTAGVARHLPQPYRFLCLTERDRVVQLPEGVERHAIKDEHLLGRGCFARLRMFDPGWQRNRGIAEGERIVSLDLDTVVTGSLHDVFERKEDFVVLRGANASNPCPFNCSVFMVRAGAHADVWSEFSVERANRVEHDSFPDDQSWLYSRIPEAAAWRVGKKSGIYAFQKPGWPDGTDLPRGARIVAFPGWRDPSKFENLSWVREHWCEQNTISASA